MDTRFVLTVGLLGGIALGAGEPDSAAATKGWLGVYTESLSRPMMIALDVEGGALVTDVADSSPASAAGIVVGDLIVSVDGRAVDGPSALRRIVRELPDRSTEVGLRRRGKSQRVKVRLVSRAASESPSEFQWQDVPAEALREARKALKDLRPGVRQRLELQQGSMESLRKEIDDLKRELEQLREQVLKREK